MSDGPKDARCMICGAFYWSLAGHVCPMLGRRSIAAHSSLRPILAAQRSKMSDMGNPWGYRSPPPARAEDFTMRMMPTPAPRAAARDGEEDGNG